MATRTNRPRASGTDAAGARQVTHSIPAEIQTDGSSDDELAGMLPDVRLHGELQPVMSREERIAHRAYRLAAARGFAPGHELDDWLAAERQIDEESSSQPADASRTDSGNRM